MSFSSRRLEGERIGLFLVPQFSLMALSAVSEPLRAANLLSDRTLYRWDLISQDGEPVSSSSGFPLVAQYSIDNAPVYDVLVVVASLEVRQQAEPRLLGWLQQVARTGTRIAGVSTASYLLARAGLLENRQCTTHWETLRQFQEEFPSIAVQRSLYVIDKDRLTCAGGTAALDLMLALVAERHGAELAAGIAENFLHTRIRGGEESQRMLVQWRFGVSDARLVKAISLMEQAEGMPLPPPYIAELVGVSPRQLERLFRKQFGISPARFYLELRLKKARILLRQSKDSIQRISELCGFSSVSHFGRAYREVFSSTPAKERHPPTTHQKIPEPPSRPRVSEK